MRRLRLWMALSLGASGLSALTFAVGMGLLPWRIMMTPQIASALLIASIGLGIVWIVLLGAAIVKIRWRALWLLVGAPGIVLGPLFLVGIAQSMDRCVKGAEPGMEMHCFP